MKKATTSLGMLGENKAAEYLLNNGYTILERNWHFGHLELDIVSKINKQIVFVEVKTRKHLGFGGALMAVTVNKQKNIVIAAQAWLQEHYLWDCPCRFDVICLTGKQNTLLLEHYPNAFDITRFMDCSYASW